MLSDRGKTLFRLIGVAILGALISIAGLPDSVSEHAEDSSGFYESDHDDTVRGHNNELTALKGHCHPGLDCLTAANYLLRPILLPERARSGKLHLWSTFQGGARWSPQFDKPPPRRES